MNARKQEKRPNKNRYFLSHTRTLVDRHGKMGRFSVDDDSDDEFIETQETTLDLRRQEADARTLESSHFPSRSISHHDTNDHHMGTFIGNQFGREVTPSRSYWRHIFLAIFCIAVRHYMPPPPPPSGSWTEFVSHSTEGFISTMTNFVALVYYIGSGCFNNMREDGIYKINALLSGEGSKNVLPCPISLPKSNQSFSFDALAGIRYNLKERIVGQKSALDSISQTLASWDIPQHPLEDDENVYEIRRPMNILLSGPDGVGKYETAKQVAALLLNGCHDNLLKEHLNCGNPSCIRDNSDRILDLQGIDFALKSDGSKVLIHLVLNHIYNQSGAGAVVIVRHVENLSLDAKLEMVRLLSKPSVSFTKTTPKTNKFGKVLSLGNNVKDLDKEEVDVRLDNCAFIFTTDLGADKIFGGLRAFGFNAPALYERVQNAVAKDVEEYFGAKVGISLVLYKCTIQLSFCHQASNNIFPISVIRRRGTLLASAVFRY